MSDIKSGLTLAVEVVKMLALHGVRGIIAGGSARDTLLGRTPKDYDIIVLGGTDEGAAVIDVLDGAGIEFQTYGLVDATYTGVNIQASHLLWVIKAEYAGVQFDIIQQRHLPETPSAAVEGFDVTLNMAWFELDDDTPMVCNHEDFPQAGEMVRILRTCDFPASRIPYLADKFPEFKWPEVSALFTAQGATCVEA